MREVDIWLREASLDNGFSSSSSSFFRLRSLPFVHHRISPIGLTLRGLCMVERGIGPPHVGGENGILAPIEVQSLT